MFVVLLLQSIFNQELLTKAFTNTSCLVNKNLSTQYPTKTLKCICQIMITEFLWDVIYK
jgi:hypothetical protein